MTLTLERYKAFFFETKVKDGINMEKEEITK